MQSRSLLCIALVACGRIGFSSSTDGADSLAGSDSFVPPGFYTIGGQASGASAGLALQNNGGDTLSVPASGPFTFATPLADGASYAVTLSSSPSGSMCYLVNPTGVVAGANVTSVSVTCLAASADPGVACGGSFCSPVTEFCCFKSGGNGMCHTSSGCSSSVLTCDDAADCPTGEVCCATNDTGVGRWSSVCGSTCTHPSLPVEIWCDPAAGGSACPSPSACSGASALAPDYHTCQ